MEQRISLITLAVDDLPRDSFMKTWGAGCAKLNMNGTVLDYIRGTAWLRINTKSAMRLRMTLGYNVREKAEVAQILERAETHGGSILKPAHNIFWGGQWIFCRSRWTCGRLRLIHFPLLPRMAGSIGARIRDQPKLDSLVKFSL